MLTLFEEPKSSSSSVSGCSGDNLRQAREYLGFSTEEVAAQLEVKPETLQNMECGKQEVNDDILRKFANRYSWPESWLSEKLRSYEFTDSESVTPLPRSLAKNDRLETREFFRVLRAQTQCIDVSETIKKLICNLKDDESIQLLHQELNTYDESMENSNIDIIKALSQIGVTLFLRPLREVLGILLKNEKNTGLLLNSFRSANELRFASASALTALMMSLQSDGSESSRFLDIIVSERYLREINKESYKIVLNLLLPDFLIASLQSRFEWSNEDLVNPTNLYQASLRLGASYQSTVMAYNRLGCISRSDCRKLMEIDVLDIKADILTDYRPKNLENIDVWRLSEREAGTLVQASSNDLFVIELKEYRSTGYRWDFESLKNLGFIILNDEVTSEGSRKIGAPCYRTLIVDPSNSSIGDYVIEESCPWQRIPTQTRKMTIKYRQTPRPKDGLYLSGIWKYQNELE